MPVSPDVDDWFATYDNPHKELMLHIRRFILEQDERITESIKWKTPTFVYRGNIASFNPRSKRHVSLMFHTGATIPGQHRSLQGGGDTAAYMTFTNTEDFNEKQSDLASILRSWITMKDTSV